MSHLTVPPGLHSLAPQHFQGLFSLEPGPAEALSTPPFPLCPAPAPAPGYRPLQAGQLTTLL